MYDSPTEFLQDVARSPEECVAQSVIPAEDGTYSVACSCGHWSTTAPTMAEGLALARRHTGNDI